MAVPREAPTAWQLLRPWPAWRGLQESLIELAGLLARTGDDGAGLLDLTTALLDDPEYAAGGFPAEYRFRCRLARAGRAPAMEDDSEPDLSAWLTELARQAADTAVMLEAAGAAWQIGQALTVDLPRTWQARLAPVLLQLRQAGRRTPHRAVAAQTGGADPAPTQAALPATGWWQLRFVVPAPDGYSVILPQAPAEGELAAARQELLYLLLRDHGLDAARLHLTLLAGGESLSHTAVLDGLGLTRARGLSAATRSDRCLQALSRLTRLRLTLLHFAQEGQVLQYARQSAPLWEVTVREYGQARLLERDGRLATHGAEWSLTARLESWAPLPELSEPARLLLTEAGGHRDDLALVLGILLGFAMRAGNAAPVAIPNWTVLRLAGADPGADADAVAPGLRRKLKAAARQQAALGWSCDLSGWPPETEAAGFLEAVTRFQSPAT